MKEMLLMNPAAHIIVKKHALQICYVKLDWCKAGQWKTAREIPRVQGENNLTILEERQICNIKLVSVIALPREKKTLPHPFI